MDTLIAYLVFFALGLMGGGGLVLCWKEDNVAPAPLDDPYRIRDPEYAKWCAEQHGLKGDDE